MFWIDIIPEHFHFTNLSINEKRLFFQICDDYLKLCNIGLKKAKIKINGLEKVVISLESEEIKKESISLPDKIIGTIGSVWLYFNFDLFFKSNEAERLIMIHSCTIKGIILLGEKMNFDYKPIVRLIDEQFNLLKSRIG